MTTSSEQARRSTRAPRCEDAGEQEWIDALRARGAGHDDAVRRLWQAVGQAARHQVHRMPQVWVELGGVRAEEIIESATDEATVAVLARLDRFEGRSRFTTWVYKFGIFHAAAEARRALWRDRPVDLEDQPEPASNDPMTPEACMEAQDFSAAVAVAMRTVLTPHQRRVARALIIDEVPIDVLAQRLATNRNALYKTLHDARVKLRAELRHRGFLPDSRVDER
ncbi:RNA polymerase sigma factor [Streptosporangium sp. NPDC087985]|uniref:RNA polymerase sigma factor n=1 Tax=Streptosporangium sp. NPDC087985 TaxID=3366196 RepID=UPI00380CCE18